MMRYERRGDCWSRFTPAPTQARYGGDIAAKGVSTGRLLRRGGRVRLEVPNRNL